MPAGRTRVIAIRAGRLFDSAAGQMLTKQVVLVTGERITDVGPEAPGHGFRPARRSSISAGDACCPG